MISIKPIKGKGLGLVAERDIDAGDIIEAAKAHPIPTECLEGGPHWEHVFPWDRTHWAVVAGYAHFINHSDDPNCLWWVNRRQGSVNITAMRKIAAGEEVTIDYCFTAEPGFEVVP